MVPGSGGDLGYHSLAPGALAVSLISQDPVRDQAQPDPLGMGRVRSFEIRGWRKVIVGLQVSGESTLLPKSIQLYAQKGFGHSQQGTL